MRNGERSKVAGALAILVRGGGGENLLAELLRAVVIGTLITQHDLAMAFQTRNPKNYRLNMQASKSIIE